MNFVLKMRKFLCTLCGSMELRIIPSCIFIAAVNNSNSSSELPVVGDTGNSSKMLRNGCIDFANSL